MQFRCVCKSWKSLISNDKVFTKLHLHRSAKNKHVLLTLEDTGGSLLYREEDEDHYLIPCPMRRLVKDPSSMINEDGCCTLNGQYCIVGSCNGLVCFHRIESNFGIRLCNPVTHVWFNISPTFTSDNNVGIGFGYDDLCDTYKVVVLLDDPCHIGCKLETMVYGTGDSCWRKLSDDPGFLLSLVQYYGQFVGGCLNWLAYQLSGGTSKDDPQRENHTDPKRFVIVSLDMHTETYKSLSLPEGTRDELGFGRHLGVLGNCMCFFQDRKGTHFDVWQLREYGVQESWTRLVSVSYEHLQVNCDYLEFEYPLMCLGEDGDILMLFRNQNSDLILYNLRDNSLKHIQLPDNKSCLDANSYVPSLISPY